MEFIVLSRPYVAVSPSPWLLLRRRTSKMIVVMNLTLAFLIATLCVTASPGVSQSISFNARNASVPEIISVIEKQTGMVFVYDKAVIRQAKVISLVARDMPVQEFLSQAFRNQPFVWTIRNKTIVLKDRPATPVPGNEDIYDALTVPLLDISGIVTDENGAPLAGASIRLKRSKAGVTSDKNGHFSLSQVNEDDVVEVSFVGYVTKEFIVKGVRSFSIQLVPAVGGLDETVVIGYGTTTRAKNTGSVSSITSEEISKQPVANPLNALQGRVAGALVTQSNGLPGSRVTIVVRGLNTLDQTGAGSQPLYIIDGIPFNIQDGQTPITNDINGRGAFPANGGISPFSIINPAEIERIDVLKDADATAIYGTRGANGVVLITTKKGKSGKTRLDLNAYKGVGKVGHFIPMMNLDQYLQMRKEAYANDAITPTAANAPDLLVWDQKTAIDWQDKYLGGTANTSDAQATVSGGDQRTRFLFNAGYHKETTVFPGGFDDYRISSRLNADHTSLNRKFNISVSANYSFGNSNLLSRDLSTLYTLPPNMPLYNANGTLSWNANFTNPESFLFVKYFGKTNNLLTNTIIRYTILPGLDIKASFGYNTLSLDQNTQNPVLSKNPLSATLTNSASFQTLNQRSYIAEPQITYTRNILKGKLSALLGTTFQHSLNTSFTITADNYSTPELLGTVAGAGTYGNPGSSYTLYRYNSLFGRVMYDWDSKYLLNAVVRRDGSSRFGADRRFGNFWSVGAGWIFSNENFAKNFELMSFGKLRASYGLTGNDQIGDYLYRTLFNPATAYQGGAAASPSRIENPALQWQTTYKLEFGIELGFLKNNLQLTANYYRNRTPNQLGFLSMGSQSGFNSYSANFDALIQNSGFEFELNTTNIRSKDFRWSTSFNATIPRTKVVSASKSYFFYNANTIGQQLSYTLRYNYRGVDAATGRPLYRDATKDSLTFSPNFSTDRSVAGYTAPKLYGGINNTFTYKQFDLSFFFQYTVQDGNILPSTAPGTLSNGNQTTYWLDRWQKPGDGATVPRYSSGTPNIYSAYSGSDAIFGNASFLRLRTVNISYSLPLNVSNRLKIDNLRIYLQGQNLWWTSKQKYVYDPETGTAMPPLRVITAGINVTL